MTKSLRVNVKKRRDHTIQSVHHMSPFIGCTELKVLQFCNMFMPRILSDAEILSDRRRKKLMHAAITLDR